MFHVKQSTVRATTNVSRETFCRDFCPSPTELVRLDRYAALLVDWQERMNLVGRSTLPYLWTRHFADSAQLLALANGGAWLDIGAGAGFPGLVVALLDAGPVHLVESVGKKCGFLRAATAALDLEKSVVVHHQRVETMPAFTVATITARACAPLVTLLGWGQRFANAETRWLLPKGASVGDELVDARRAFAFDAQLVPSRTDPRGQIIVAHNVRRR